MTERLWLTARDRVMVVAPHPDDEALAAGGLLSTASRVGAAARVVYFTDGDNNPWLRATCPVAAGLPLGEESQRAKREAICCHESQLLWRRRQHLAFVTPTETF